MYVKQSKKMTNQKTWKTNKKRRTVPIGEGFTGKDRENTLNKFFASPENKKLWERLDETKQRLPWTRSTVDSLKTYAEKTGKMTEKQKSFATSLYIDTCVIGDDKLFEQVETRKLGFRLMQLELRNVQSLVTDIMFRTNTKSFSLGQIRAFQNIAKRQQAKLTKVKKLTDGVDFDGWNLTKGYWGN